MIETVFARPPQIQELEKTLNAKGYFAALSQPQRISIRDLRDGGACQFPEPHYCTPDHLEVHHIQPQAWARIHGIPMEAVDNPYNTITICSEAHDRIHPERQNARARYALDKSSFANMRPEKRPGGIYWNNMYDGQLQQIARDRTEQARAHGWQFPD